MGCKERGRTNEREPLKRFRLEPRLLAYLLRTLPAICVLLCICAAAAQSATSMAVNYRQTVDKRTPIIQWAMPADVTYGTTLGPLQLAATADTPGAFVYTPAAGTILGVGTKTLIVSFTPTDSNNYNSATATVQLEVTKAQATISLSDLQHVFNGQPQPASATTVPAGLAVTFAYNGSATVPSAPGSYAVTATINDANYSGSATGTLTILSTAPSITLSSSTPKALVGGPLTLVAAFGSLASSPSGDISFQDGTTLLGSASIAAGQAVFTTSSLSVGDHIITATYAGDANSGPAVSNQLTVSIIDYAMTSPTETQTITAGSPATFDVSITPTAGNSIPLPATLTVTGLPAGVTASVSPSQWAVGSGNTWTLPANTPIPKTSISFAMVAAKAELIERVRPPVQLAGICFAVLMIPFLAAIRRGRKTLQRAVFTGLSCVGIGTILLGLSGCIASYGFLRTPPKTYAITVTITAGSLSHSTTLNLTVP